MEHFPVIYELQKINLKNAPLAKLNIKFIIKRMEHFGININSNNTAGFPKSVNYFLNLKCSIG